MYLRGTGLPQQAHNLPAGGAPDNGIVNQHHTLAVYRFADGVEFDFYLVQPFPLAGRNKGSADVFVFQEA